MSLHWVLAEITVPAGVSNRCCLTLVRSGLGFICIVCFEARLNLFQDLGRGIGK